MQKGGYWCGLLLSLLATITECTGQETAAPRSDSNTQQPAASPTISMTQVTTAPASSSAGSPEAARLGGTSQLAGAALLPGTAPAQAAGEGLFQWGVAHLHPHLTYEFTYGNELQPAPGVHADTAINSIAPGILILLGSHWTLDYTPTLRFYSSSSFQDGTDQSVSLSGSTTYQDWSFGLSQGYTISSQPLVETGAQTDQETFSTSLNATYQMNTKVSLELNLSQNFRFVGQTVTSEPLNDMREWSTMEWLNYQVWPRLDLGLGAGFIYDDLQVGPDTTSEQLQGRIIWQAGNKLHVVLTGGVDYRQFLDSETPALLSPIYSLSLQYKLFETTGLSLSASSGVSPSYFQNSLSQVTGINAGIQQRLLRRFYLSVNGGYSTTTYHASAPAGIPSDISDYDSTSFSVSLGTAFLKRGSASVFYQVGANTSTAALYNYTTRQVGLSLAWHF